MVDPLSGYRSFEKKIAASFTTDTINAETKEKMVNNYDMPSVGVILPVFTNDGEKKFKIQIYNGPLLYENLKALNAHVYSALEFGWFAWLGIPMLVVLKFFYSIFHNYGLAIILLTVLIKAVLWWPTHSSYKSMKKMQEAQPHLKAIKERHKDNMQKQQEEMMKLYKEKKINPLGGCLPMLLQLPIFFALYSLLVNAIELRNAGFVLWITDLSLKDPYYVLPVLMGVSMFIQQKMTPTTDPQQAKMFLFMPFIMTFLFSSLPAGVILYWVVQNILSILQQYLVNVAPAKVEVIA